MCCLIQRSTSACVIDCLRKGCVQGRSFVIAGRGPGYSGPSAETFMSVQCASPGRGGELVGVCGVCASCVGWRKG